MEAMDGAEGASDATKQKPVTNAGRQYYFVSVKVDADTGVTSAAERSPFVGLQIGLLLGKGAYGRVYKGYYHGNVVAVKVSPAGTFFAWLFAKTNALSEDFQLVPDWHLQCQPKHAAASRPVAAASVLWSHEVKHLPCRQLVRLFLCRRMPLRQWILASSRLMVSALIAGL